MRTLEDSLKGQFSVWKWFFNDGTWLTLLEDDFQSVLRSLRTATKLFHLVMLDRTKHKASITAVGMKL